MPKRIGDAHSNCSTGGDPGDCDGEKHADDGGADQSLHVPGAANDPDLIYEIGRVTALEMLATGLDDR